MSWRSVNMALLNPLTDLSEDFSAALSTSSPDDLSCNASLNSTSLSCALETPAMVAGLPEVVAVSLVVAILSLVTSGGNLMVLISFKMDRQLQTVSNYFLLSLAVADFVIGLVSMPLYTVYLLMKRWPLGPIICDAWLSLDYTMSNASVANLLIISFDRYFSVTYPLTYRARRTPRKAAVLIAVAWIVSVLLWTPWIWMWPYIEGERQVNDNECFIQFLETNKYLTVSTAIAAFYLPVIIMCVLYFRVYRATERRQRDLAYLQPVIVGRRHFSLKTPSRCHGNNTNGSCTPESATLTKLSLDQTSTCRNSRSSSPATRPRWFIWNRTPTPGTGCLDPVTPLDLITQSNRSHTSDSVVEWPLGCDRLLATSSYGGTDCVVTSSSSSSGNHLIRSVSGINSEIETPIMGLTAGSTRSLLELCRGHKVSAGTATGEDIEEEFDESPDEGNSVLLTPMTAISILALTPREESQLGGQEGASDVTRIRPPVSRPQIQNNISIIDEEVQTGNSRTDEVDLPNSRTSGHVPVWSNSSSTADGDHLSQRATRVVVVPPSGDEDPRVTLTGSGHQQMQQRRRHSEKKQERKAAKTLSAILLAFVVTWTPYNVLIIIKAFAQVDSSLYDFSYWLCYLNSTVNPLLYALCNANFRRTYWRILTCRWVKLRPSSTRSTYGLRQMIASQPVNRPS